MAALADPVKSHYVESPIARVIRFVDRSFSQVDLGAIDLTPSFCSLSADILICGRRAVEEAPDEGASLHAMSISFAAARSVSKVGQMKRQADAAVLLVGNDLDVAEEIRFHLQAGGHPVWLSQTTRDALRAARSGWPSVLVVDRALNGEDGLSIVETLRQEIGRTAPDGIQAARIYDAPSRSGPVTGEAARRRLEFQVRRPEQRGRRADRQSASQARSDRGAAIHRLRSGGRLQAEGR